MTDEREIFSTARKSGMVSTISDRLIRAISGWGSPLKGEDPAELVAAGADVNAMHGMILPLHCSCNVGEYEYAEMLIQNGADLHALDGYSRSAIHYAAERHSHLLPLLFKHGADLDALDYNRDTALHWASYKNNVASVRYLLQHGANVNPLDTSSNSPIRWAALKANLEVIKVLLDYNADVVDISPLVRAATNSAAELCSEDDELCIDLLLRATGQFDMRDAAGRLPNIIARDKALSAMLMTYCASPRKLKHLCRYEVRKNLGRRHLPPAVLLLPLPQRLKDYVLLLN